MRELEVGIVCYICEVTNFSILGLFKLWRYLIVGDIGFFLLLVYVFYLCILGRGVVMVIERADSVWFISR